MGAVTDPRDVADLAAELADGKSTPFGAYVFAADDPRSRLARSVEEAVFDEVFGNSPDLLAAEYGRFEAATVFSCIVDHRRRRPAAAKRLIFDSPAGFKSLTDIELGPWARPVDEVLARTGLVLDRARTLDVATAAVAPEYRGSRTDGLVSLAMNQVTSRLSVLCDIAWWVTILDVHVLELYQTALHEPMRYYHGIEPLSYLDSPLSVPVYCDIEAWRRRLAAVDPVLHSVLIDGVGLGDAVDPFPADEARRALAAIGVRTEHPLA
jgi:hypothetical protein